MTRALAATTSALFVCLVLGAPARADVRRCEDGGGRVTYSNEACPTGTAKERPVEQRPAVEVPHEGTGGKASLEGVVKRAEPLSAARERSPEHSLELSREQNKAQVARCDDLVRRIEYGQQDLLTTTGTERASVELSLRRLQDEHQANCAARH
jgi:hypothetical protein